MENIVGSYLSLNGCAAKRSPVKDLAIQAKATTAIAHSTAPATHSPNTILPMPNSVAYTAITPASQFAQAHRPPGISSLPYPSFEDTRSQPGPPGRTRL